jgi:hypothetical protein
VVMATKWYSASLTIASCMALLCGSPALAPMGTKGATARGVPYCLAIGGSAAMMMVGIPAPSIALCTITAER